MPRSFTFSIGSLILTAVCLMVVSNGQAATVSELLDAMKQRQQSIQDYDFVVSTSNFIKKLDQAVLENYVQKKKGKWLGDESSLSVDEIKRRTYRIELLRQEHARNMFTGTVFHYRGIGTKIKGYAVSSMPDPKTVLTGEFLNAPAEEQTDEKLETLLENNVFDPKLQFRQHRLVLPNMSINGMPPSEFLVAGGHPDVFDSKNKLEEAIWLEIPMYSTVYVNNTPTQESRHTNFPFWHEEVLSYATEDNTQIVNETDDEIELLISPKDAPQKLVFRVFCSLDGRVNRFIKELAGKTMAEVDYHNFVTLSDGIEVPQAGKYKSPAKHLDSSSPRPETTRFASLLNGEVNIGLTLDDLSMQVPKNTTILDHRGNGETRIVTTQPVRLGASLPENIGQLLKSE